MAETIGTVQCINISSSIGIVGIREQGTTTGLEAFIIWFGFQFSSNERVLHSMWLSLFKEAFTTGDTVSIIHPDDGADIQSVRLNKTSAST